ncbi:thioredoxin-disulfide reductase [Sinanaerobacter sp. ZZT-01]|uniref:thioredoxin-disulfide reductase n=1 Tax=Sinanaerobacter sp. ZZT-01 TaxID=3111540 RepID=UPI003A970BB2
MKVYDVVIVGGGPAGLSAALYAGRATLSTLLIEKEQVGGQIIMTSRIENYPGCVEEESGATLIDRMKKQAANFGVETISDEITEVDFSREIKVLKGQNETYRAKAIIIASGATSKRLGCEGEEMFIGRGVSYCATCDASFFRGLDVFVVGGGDTAVEEALFLTKFARKVTIIHRRDQLRAAKSIQEKARKNPKISFIWNSAIESLSGDGILEKVVIKNLKTGEKTEYVASPEDMTFGVFIFVGYEPNADLFKNELDLDKGYIKTDELMQTSVDGVYAAGDVRVKSLRQVVTAVADGAVSAVQAEKYINSLE